MDGVQVRGESGQPVLLLPGGAEGCDGFFPGLPEGLVADPGARVILHDRPGTGTSTVDGSLAGAAAYLGSLVERLGLGPVVVVGQSLGGAVGVLLDPTPINDAKVCAGLERTMRVLGRLSAVPGLRQVLAKALRTTALRTGRDLRPDCQAALERTADLDIPTLVRAVRGVTDLARDLRESDLPRLPSVVVTADRKPDHAVHRAHERLATAFGAQLVSWPGATHSVHLDHPDEVLATVREVVAG
ncbi:alpha/beta fold hydrolase [Amycolatopsis sp. FBCC-B4732]|uniref:alpha/beta fold hydrolase n=1 Tax=Amycolatopsis sp. FBCC-B4732 TaxID=3079339 RepID=UPI00248C9009|nr:alpha/beta hydrolase [Amycolatopsis sp. FBCC-B4732]